ncbi:hypothetical protein A1Q1_03162 [Trichosporon asahii var. asahii CBS 2479]|uniref:FAD dependent oxidoreductase domain-containing protein n=1 Tax=Trichosporon asahii var. asahii (strain ATCC 90039 / CBS 2479 / JCM 2466 / KCTC 7840 / NBRC 103889/ NCYC 2677 / UAMH 7654) TaxID=1186058 RepID=J6EYK2_TRIAS|nr:hypothetical protein A1Q1_03162 [Trichosporon asahii var. asahii CBS 2479]EJT47927.1 hypothetical protein A1Q1_03162 [Trichosporon asahii var. asahii CBS 2479]
MTKPLSEGGAGLKASDAVDVYHFEMENLDYVEDVVRREKLDADFWRGHRLEVFTSEEGAKRNEETLDKFMRAQEEGRHKGKAMQCKVLKGDEAKRRARMQTATAVTTVPAGSWHPHRGVTGLMRRALEQGVKLFSWTPVMSLHQQGGEGWIVDCGDRGKIKAKNVVLATNGYTRYLTEGDLAKQLDPHAASIADSSVIPYRGHCGIVVPPTSYAGTGALDATYGVEDGPYLIQTPHAGLVLGPYNATVISQHLSKASELYGVDDDSVVLPKLKDWIANWCKDNYEGWGEEKIGEGLARVWSGVMGHSVDWVPLYGGVPGKDGLWAAVGYNGEFHEDGRRADE